MNRARLMEEIAELDRKMNQLADKTRVPDLNMKHRSFPKGSWSAAILFIAFWAYGGSITPQWHDTLGLYVGILGILMLLLAFWNTFMWVVKGRSKTDKKYAEASVNITALQEQKKQLQKQLALLDE